MDPKDKPTTEIDDSWVETPPYDEEGNPVPWPPENDDSESQV